MTVTAVARHRTVLALGSNLGRRLETLQTAVDVLDDTPGIEIVRISPVYETAPVGGPEQPDYLNAVVVARTSLPKELVFERFAAIEQSLHRVREQHWGPRTIDIDMVTYDSVTSDDPRLTLPHPRAHERAFVLAPWHDIEPDAELPGHGAIARLLAGLSLDGVRRRGDLVLQPPS
jgi:2-amino-4-hydroxy-6-hydroxymethyldihydropteridine diphosphokinase